jgi:hypothetical protein
VRKDAADGHETECAGRFSMQAASVVPTRSIVLRNREQVVLCSTELRQVTFLPGVVSNREKSSVRPVLQGSLRGQIMQEARKFWFSWTIKTTFISWASGSLNPLAFNDAGRSWKDAHSSATDRGKLNIHGKFMHLA